MPENNVFPWEIEPTTQNSTHSTPNKTSSSTSLPSWYFEIQQSAADYGTPEFPTISQAQSGLGAAGPANDFTGEKRVPLRPRDAGPRPAFITKNTPPTASQPQRPTLPTNVLSFQCPACFQPVHAPFHMLHYDFTCPSCQSLVSPPRLVGAVSPTSHLTKNQERQEIYRPDRDKADVRFLHGEVRVHEGHERHTP